MHYPVARFFLHYVLQHRLAFLIFLISPLSIVLKANVIPYALKLIIDAVSNHQHDRENIFEILNGTMWLGGTAWLGLIAIERFQWWMQSVTIPKFEADMRLAALEHTLKHSCDFFYNQFSGSIVNKVTSLIKSIDSIRKILINNIISASLVITVAMFFVYHVSPIFSIIISFWIVFHLATTLIFVKKINLASALNAEHKSIINGFITDVISNITTVKLFCGENYELSKLHKLQHQELVSNRKMISNTNQLCFFFDFFVTLVLFATFYLLLKKWQENLVTSGDVVFVFYMIFAIMNQIWQLGYALAEFFREIGCAQQSLKVLSQTPQIVDKPNALPLRVASGKIEFRNVYFDYNEGKSLFHNFNLIIEPCQKVGIVGCSGAGKSSLVSLLLRLYEPKSGSIFIDEQDISQVQQSTLRNSISVIMQDTCLFHRTLKENIAYGKTQAKDEELLAASINAHCHEFISQLPKEYNTLIGERGVKLSGGQRQRIAIARVLLKKSNIIILDEATSALDSENELLIQQGLNTLMADKTFIVIAHRLSTLIKMDRIIVFEEGKIVEEGKHEDLLKAQGYYARLWKNQANI